jgi:hypothetical protein
LLTRCTSKISRDGSWDFAGVSLLVALYLALYKALSTTKMIALLTSTTFQEEEDHSEASQDDDAEALGFENEQRKGFSGGKSDYWLAPFICLPYLYRD